MLTFEKVLEVFKDYFEKDTICEVVQTKRGYTIMYWEEKDEQWYGVEHCKAPEEMMNILLDGYADYLEQGYTKNRRDLTDDEQAAIKSYCNKMRENCKN